MSESQPTIDLASLFDKALQAVAGQREEINALDGFNGNHGDNMVSNMRVVADTIHAHNTDVPSKALRSAGLRLSENGQGGTSQYYAQGLLQASEKFEGQSQLVRADGMTLIETLLGAIPAESAPSAQQSTPSVFDMVLGMAGVQQPQAQPQQQSQLGGVMDLLGGLLGGQQQPQVQPQPQTQPQNQLSEVMDLLGGMMGGQQQPQAQAQQPQDQLGGVMGLLGGLMGTPQQTTPAQQDTGLDLGDILGRLLPAGLAYMQAQQSGADPTTKRLAFIRALLGAQPRQAQTPRQAAGTVVAQSILQALMAR
ncbi:MAG: hypothetical protein JXR84_05405 [Anaerolineae bacterium]|nr:hypothetical protein [Anaerolineae bacterium]